MAKKPGDSAAGEAKQGEGGGGGGGGGGGLVPGLLLGLLLGAAACAGALALGVVDRGALESYGVCAPGPGQASRPSDRSSAADASLRKDLAATEARARALEGELAQERAAVEQ